MDHITRDELRQRLESGESLTIVEVLPEPYFRKAHLPGAINIPPGRIDELASSLLPNHGAEIIVYCSGRACPDSAVAAQALTALGYIRVRKYAGGKQDWIAAGLTTENHHGQRQPNTITAGEGAPVACGLGEDDLAARSAFVRRELFSGAEERRELDAGYTFRFPGEGDWKARIEDFVSTERRCCSFFRIEVAYEPAMGPIWMTLTGPAGTKQFIEQTFAVTTSSEEGARAN